MRGLTLVLALLLVLPQGTTAGPALFWSAVDDALTRYPRVHRSAADLRAAREAIPQSAAKLLPSATVEGSQTLESRERYRQLGVGHDSQPTTLGLSVTQPLFNYASYLGRQQSEFGVAAAREELERVRQEVVLQVATLTAEWLQARDVMELADAYRQVMNRHRQINQLRLRAGESTVTDMEEATSRAAQAEAAFAEAKKVHELARMAFREVVGSHPPRGIALPDLQWDEPETFEDRARLWIEDRHEIRAARQRVREWELGTEARQAEHLPTVDVSYRSSRTWDKELGGTAARSLRDDVDNHSLMVVMNLPLYKGGETVSRARESAARKDGMLAELEFLRNQALREAYQARAEMVLGRQAINQLTRAREASQRALAGVQEEYLAGTRTLMDLLDAQFEQFTVQSSLVRQLYGEQLARIKLWRALGRPLTPEGVVVRQRGESRRQWVAATTPPITKPELPTLTVAATQGDNATPPATPTAPAPRAETPAPPPTDREGDTRRAAARETATAVSATSATGPDPLALAGGEETAAAPSIRWEGGGSEVTGEPDTALAILTAWSRGARPVPLPVEGSSPATALLPAPPTAGGESTPATTPMGEPAPALAAPIPARRPAVEQPLVAMSRLTRAVAIQWPPAAPGRTGGGGFTPAATPAPTMTLTLEGSLELTRTIPYPVPPGIPPPQGFPTVDREGAFLVHAGTFPTLEELEQVAGLLSVAGYPAFRDSALTPTGEREVLRLLSGPFRDYEAALKAGGMIQRQLGITVGYVSNPRLREVGSTNLLHDLFHSFFYRPPQSGLTVSSTD